MTEWDYECAVIGGGPGGLVSALYLQRFRRDTVLINSGKPRAAWIPRTHNLIGYNRGISGKMLLKRLHRQVDSCHLPKINARARVSRYRNGFRVEVDNGTKIKAKKVILATGMTDVEPEIDNLVELRNLGLLRYCSICDGYEYQGEPLVVLAANDAGLQKAIFISRWTNDLRVIIPPWLKPAPHRIKELSRIANAKLTSCRTLKMSASSRPKGLYVCIDEQEPIYARAAYVELGSKVNDSAFKDLKKLKRTKEGFLITTTEQRTSIPGLFAVGDCVNVLSQISVAAGQAAVAATTIHNDLL